MNQNKRKAKDMIFGVDAFKIPSNQGTFIKTNSSTPELSHESFYEVA